ncbi:MAG: hypothetical protein ACSW8C_04515 [bacterium]
MAIEVDSISSVSSVVAGSEESSKGVTTGQGVFSGGKTFSLSDKVADKTSCIVADSSVPVTSKLVDSVLSETEPKDPTLGSVTEEAIIAEFEAGIIIDSEEASVQSPDWVQVYSNLEKFREELGGQEPINKKFFGIKWEVCQANVRNALEHNWWPKPFWKICAKFFGVNLEENPLYAHIKTTIDAINWFEVNKKVLTELHKKDPWAAVRMFEKATGQLWHPNLNKPEMLVSTLEEVSNAIKQLFGNNTTTVAKWEQAFDATDCCFPARQRRLFEFLLSKKAQSSDDLKATSIVFNNPSDKQLTISEVCFAITTNLQYIGYNPKFSESYPKDQMDIVYKALEQQISELEKNGDQQSRLTAKSLREIKQADIAKYFCDVFFYDATDFTEGFTINENTVTFSDGSQYTFEE